MGRVKVKIPKNLLKRMYYDQNLSSYSIGKKFNCSWSTIINRLKEFGLPLKSPALSRMKYKKKDFNGTEAERAYMTGFRIGDLNVYRVSKSSETIVVRCHTTQQEQADLIKSLFSKFGRVNDAVSSGGHYYMNCFLNNSFEFLFPKDESALNWIKKSATRLAFIAGYTDAEGNFIISQGRARFKIDSYDKDVLGAIARWLSDVGISYKMRLIFKKGDKQKIYDKTGVYSSDLWRLNINKARSLEKFVKKISPYLKHRKRVSDAKMVLRNINDRRFNGTI